MRVIPLKIDRESSAAHVMAALGVSKEGIKILASKSVTAVFKIEGIRSWAANILKQHLLSLGSDAAIERDALIKDKQTNVLVFGNCSQLRKLSDKLKNQPFGLQEVSQKISAYLDNLFKTEYLFRARDKIIKIRQPVICGIVNVTPDSFSGDGVLRNCQHLTPATRNSLLQKVEQMVKNGAKIIDIGGESSRPFAKAVSEKEEMKRVIPVVKLLRKEFKKTLFSIDTYKDNVAYCAVQEGIDIINDITGLRKSGKMAELIKKHKLGCILMHMRGVPQTMQIGPQYEEPADEIVDFFEERLSWAVSQGIHREQICIDPGVGFGKRLSDNVKIINELYKLKGFGVPIFLGLSRKTFVGDILNVPVQERLIGTLAASAVAVMRGANILRTHDVRETAETLRVVSHITGD